MQINHVTLNNGTVISYDFDEVTGLIDRTAITIETDTEVVVIEPILDEGLTGTSTLQITYLDDESDDDDDDFDFVPDCGDPNCDYHAGFRTAATPTVIQ